MFPRLDGIAFVQKLLQLSRRTIENPERVEVICMEFMHGSVIIVYFYTMENVWQIHTILANSGKIHTIELVPHHGFSTFFQ